MNKYAIILAAGKGTRMQSDRHKVLHNICGKPMIEHILNTIDAVSVDKKIMVLGHHAQSIQDVLGDKVTYVLQEEQLGTAHAVKQAKDELGTLEGITVVMLGDTPLMTGETLEKAITHHLSHQAKATVLTAVTDNPAGYGRIVRDSRGHVLKNVEHKDANVEELAIKEINTGTYIFDNQLLFEVLDLVNNNNAQGEYYLPNVLEILKAKDEVITAYQMSDFSESLGVNDRVQLAQVEKIMRARINTYHMTNGVTLIDPNTTYIDSDVVIGKDTIIEPSVLIKGKSIIGENCFISMNSELDTVTMANNVSVRSSCLEYCSVAQGSDVGPMAHIRPNSKLGEQVHVGNFVEVKNSVIGDYTKMGHLTYIGDADLGDNINVGCGTILVNYDGVNKFRSTIENNAFIGCNANIVSPVTIGEGAFVAAGVTVTKDVPSGALALGRSQQENKADYVAQMKQFKQ